MAATRSLLNRHSVRQPKSPYAIIGRAEARMTNVEVTSAMTRVRPTRPAPIVGDQRVSGFVIRHSFDILFSSFDISYIGVQESRTVI
jgi:hypothetical protein